MEALWNLEDKWKLSTPQAFILLTCTAAAIVGLCAAAWAKKRKGKKQERRRTTVAERWLRWAVLERRRGSGGGETPIRLLGGEGEELGSRNSTAAVWQRPILMGEKCEMLKYSGLILYDERGRLLQDQITAMENGHKVLLRRRSHSSEDNVEGSTLMSSSSMGISIFKRGVKNIYKGGDLFQCNIPFFFLP